MYHLNITEAFKKYTKKHSLQKNVNQEDLIKTLDTLTEQLKPSFLKSVTSIFSSKKPKGFYLYGDVGAGKTMIVNFFLEYLNHPRVLKTHFNKFMVDIHNKLHKLKNESNPLPKIVKTFKKDFDIIFFDEFQITNIADAMILGKLLEQFFSNNIFIITTSNVKPDDLYLGGLQRDQFLPYIENIKDNTLVYSLNSGKDYRELYLNKQNRFFIVKDPQTKKNFNQVLFTVLSGKQFATKEIEIKGRKLIIDNYVSGVAKFDFKDLCFQTYGSEDYIEICKITKIFFIENIPNFTNELINEQYRFINLIDIIYDNQLSLVATASVPINQITSSVKLAKVFQRTLSRLGELTRSN
jgi:cell division protein ZapE